MRNKIILYIVGVILTYLAISFIKWEFNPAMWKQEIRSAFILLSIASAALLHCLDEIVKLS